MSYLLDTNIISEMARPEPNPNVTKWFKKVKSEKLFLSVLTVGEIRRGVELLASSKRKTKLLHWLESELTAWFGDNILPINQTIAEEWGVLTALFPQIPAIDSLIAATALTYRLKLVTRNTKDFIIPQLEIINPFAEH
jgi:predicted nucleic acid-binding protein